MANSLLVSAADTGLLVIDVQEKLFHMVIRHEAVERDMLFLLDVANTVKIPVLATEQYPKGLGGTIASVKSKLSGAIPDKLTFSCCGNPEVVQFFKKEARPKLILIGIETHVCVQQTALDLVSLGFQIFLPVDAVSCRYPQDHHTALRRMENAGVVLTTVEALAFELVGTAGTPEFKAISKLVQERMKHLSPSAVPH
ncbi:MAG: isochorismatase family protein [Gemmatales bacterium]